MIKQSYEIREKFERMSNPLFIQAFIMLFLIPRTLYHGILYYAERIPRELERFYWTVDAKGDKVLEYEEAWSTLIYATMSSQSFNDPIEFVEGGDYSYFDRFNRNEPINAEFAKEFEIDPDEVQDINLKMILGEHLTFGNSENSLGLQLADILVTATRRAIKGNLSQPGWEEIGSLMIKRKLNGSANGIQAMKLNLEEAKIKNSEPIQVSRHVFETYLSKGKSIFRPEE
jgi:hypothetical protein